ncbi:hypothetical protein [Actinocatenispora sera]|uniref:Uncharacterized protein n=1 Tax=Actinocatenispora sera TaxID=390989 RepID=A0A810KVQ0_9ACTN|nr:hypothetical protein [Actinocatenispora sera]BCJ26542.1 hypothetical protein Asera_06500 [Actinocatenispora sera]
MSAGSTDQLSDRDLHALVSALGRGEQPRVAVHTAHGEVPAGTKGVLVDHDPDADLPCTVRITRNGSEQDVRLPTTVLTVVPRGRADVIARTAATDPDATGPASAPTRPTSDAASGADPTSDADPASDAATGAGPASDAATGAGPAGAAGRADSAGVGEAARAGGASASDGESEAAPARRGRPAKAAAKKAARGSAGDVVITVTVAGDGATVEASHGSRKLVKPTPLPVTAGHAVARAIDIESITGAVETVIDEHRSAKQAEAEALRARLAELERELAGYPGADDAEPAGEPEPAAAS